MKWHRKLYAGESISKRQTKIKWKIMHNAGQIGVYVLTLAANPANLIDIIPSWELLQKHYPKKDLYVIGLAGNYEEALLLAGQIVQEVYAKTDGFDIRSYIQERGKQTT
ncbi:MAG: hypothetical protein J6A75_01360 [Lachnospiraceae bacterium]|nr:hypothetical protein [Lachnospiraceae bacterium]